MTIDLFGHVARADTGDRSVLDFYETPAWMVRSLVHHFRLVRGARVLECASGNDAITSVLRDEYGCTVFTNDLNPVHPAQTCLDATSDAYWAAAPAVDFVITNPPFAVAFEMLTRAHRHARVGVMFLLRKTFLEPTRDRALWLEAHVPAGQILLPRHKFRADSEHGDSVSCDWMVWLHGKASRHRCDIYVDHTAKNRRRAA